MKEPKFLGALLPSHPAITPIIDTVRKKYQLAEISPDEDPIQEIYLGDEFVTLEVFRQDVGDILREDLSFLSPSAIKQYEATKLLSQHQRFEWLDGFPDDYKTGIESLMNLAKTMSLPILQGLETFIDNVADMICIYLLTGEVGEVPADWSGRVMTISNNDETAILVLASQLSNPEEVVQQFRHEYKKAFGVYRPRITKKVVNSGYYMQLKRQKKSWAYIVEEFIRLEDIKLPRNTNSKGYTDRMRIIQQTLKKRLQRAEKILDIILRDKN